MRISIRNKILLVFLPLFAAFMGLSSYLTGGRSAEMAKAAQKGDMAHIAEGIVRSLETWFDTRENLARTVAQNPIVIEACQGESVEEARTIMVSHFKEMGVYENFFIMDRNGVIQIAADSQAEGLNVFALPQYRNNIEKAQRGESFTGNAYASPVTGRPVSLITTPIRKDGEVVGILGTPVELREFSQFFIEPVTVCETGGLAIIDQNGIALAHQNPEYILKVDLSGTDFGKTALRERNGEVFYRWEGENKLSVFREYPKQGWIVMALVPVNEFLAPVRTIQFFSILIMLGGIAAAAVVTFIFAKNLAVPIKKGVDFARRIAEGDFTDRLEVRTKDEIGNLAEALNDMTENLTEMVNQVRNASEQVSAGAEQLAQSAQSLSSSATEQAASLEETSASIEELTASVQQNADNAKQALEVTNAAGPLMQEGSDKVSRTVEAMKRIAQQIQIVNDIADQTNLLALNAAIEAARAGEMGKGFAVVAVEVRKLAERSQQAAGEITQLATGSVQLAEQAGEAIGKVAPMAARTASMVQEITSASEEQAAGTEQISLAVQQLDSVTQQNSATSEETASASEQLSAQAQTLQELVSRFMLRS